ncbi:hypothetical protein SAMN05518866_12221 [Sphingobium sp. YR768]|jgi:hypothetical protein|nr:hypothetical protein SAMN05518866_12221 [Sphingobium sp. YR768]
MVECKQQPFALSLSKGSTERSEVSSLRSDMGFDFAQPERIF